jgi:hypothetical protein
VQQLGIYYGNVVDIARQLADKAFYELCFHKTEKPVVQKTHKSHKCKQVHISFDRDSGTWSNSMNSAKRVNYFKALLGNKVVVEESNYYSCVLLKFKPEKGERPRKRKRGAME